MDLASALLIILADPNEIVRACNALPTDCEIYRPMYEAHVGSTDLASALLIILTDPNEIVRACNALPANREIYRPTYEAHVSNLLAWVQ